MRPLTAVVGWTDVVFAPDGRRAYAVGSGNTQIMELAIDGVAVTPTGRNVATGRGPYGAMITPDGAWLINTNVGGMLESDAAFTYIKDNIRARNP